VAKLVSGRVVSKKQNKSCQSHKVIGKRNLRPFSLKLPKGADEKSDSERFNRVVNGVVLVERYIGDPYMST